MSAAIVSKDLLVLRRESLMKALLAVILALLVVSLGAGLQREQVFAKEKAAAEVTDKDVWMNQGDRNPHSAAHFSRYAFRPASPLALIDPGTSDFAGLAVWMEAHYQDPAVFRRAEDGGELSRYTQLTPAFLLLTAAPLLVFLMMSASIAGEREDGTLRQLLAAGVSGRQFFSGKFGAGLRLTVMVFTLVFLALAVFALLTAPVAIDADAILRLVGLFVVFSVYLAICVALALGVSALFRTRQAAFLALAGVWALTAVLLPRFAADVGTSIYPQPDAREVSGELGAASYTFYEDKERQERIEQELLKEHGVSTVEELPINYGAYRLQISEELSIPEFERVYEGLARRYSAQDNTARWFSLLTPAIAAAKLSRGFAGTDRVHQHAFTTAAELHRRDMIKLLNDDLMFNASNDGTPYTADAALWAQFEDFEHRPPGLSAVFELYVKDALLLFAWLAAALVFEYSVVVRAVRHEVPTA
ncbi:MAG: DUF3526 domain-containing protein [Pseudomonadota bacterium]